MGEADAGNELAGLLGRLIEALEDLAIPYAVGGSVASMAYGEPRATRDIDVVVDLDPSRLAKLQARFPSPSFYFNDIAAAEALRHGGEFNIIQAESGLKVDVFVAREPRQHLQIRNARRVAALPGHLANVSPPEELILKKLEYHRMGGSDKHLRDIAAMLQISPEEIDREYITREAEKLGVDDLWAAVVRRVDEA